MKNIPQIVGQKSVALNEAGMLTRRMKKVAVTAAASSLRSAQVPTKTRKRHVSTKTIEIEIEKVEYVETVMVTSTKTIEEQLAEINERLEKMAIESQLKDAQIKQQS